MICNRSWLPPSSGRLNLNWQITWRSPWEIAQNQRTQIGRLCENISLKKTQDISMMEQFGENILQNFMNYEEIQ